MVIEQTGRAAAQAVAMLICVLSLSIADSSHAVTITLDFDNITHGKLVNGGFELVTISAYNATKNATKNATGSLHSAASFGLHQSFTRVSDLHDSDGAKRFRGGKIEGDDLGTLLTLQKNSRGCWSGACNKSEAYGHRPTEFLGLDFSVPALELGFAASDIESTSILVWASKSSSLSPGLMLLR